MPARPSKEDFLAWLQDPCTDLLRAWARAKRDDLKERWALGHYSDTFDTAMLVKNAGATGACSVLKDLIELDYDEIVKEIESGEQERAETFGPGSAGQAVRAGDSVRSDSDT